VASLCTSASLAAPQNLIRLVPATGFNTIQANAIEAKAVGLKRKCYVNIL